MSYLNDRLSVLAYANGFTLWHFRPGPDGSRQDRTLDGCLADAGKILRVNDLVIVDPPAETDDVADEHGDRAVDGGGFFRVTSARRGDVRVQPLF